jgi:acetyl esterase/lipase
MNHTKTTYTYKVVDDCAFQVDVYTTNNTTPSPAILWLHGGGLILGSRQMLPGEQAERYIQAGFSVVAVDYRLAPETKAAAIVEDVLDAYHWIQNQGENIGVDASRTAIVGHSAGGYLAIFAGARLLPKPRAVISFYGYGDISGEWAVQPNQPYRALGLISEEEARQNIGTAVTSQSSVGERLPYYLYCRQQGTWAREIVGDEFDGHISEYCPVHAISADYPPTLLLHGDEDIDVPVSESLRLAEQLSGAGVAHQKIILPGYGHGFDTAKEGLQDPPAAQAFAEVLEFLARYCD